MEPSATQKRHTGLVWAVVVIAGFAIFTGLNVLKLTGTDQAATRSVAEAPVAVFAAAYRQMDSRLELIGNVRPAVSVHVFSRVPGQIVATIPVDKGDAVTAGDIVATLQRDIIDAQLAEARAGLAAATAGRQQAQAKLAVLEKDRQRLTALYAEKAVARQTLDHIEAEVTATGQAIRLAEAQESRARAVIRQLGVQSDNHVIRAPADGVIAARHMDPGALTVPGAPIVSISDERTVKVVVSVTEKELPRIRLGMPVRIGLDAVADGSYTGTVDLISPTVDPATRSADVEVHLPNPDGRLAPGMYARASILIETRRCLAIPSDGLIRVPGTGERFVFVVENGRAVQRNVTTGLTADALVEITTGISADEPVVVRGQGRLRDGVPVRISDTVAAADPHRT